VAAASSSLARSNTTITEVPRTRNRLRHSGCGDGHAPYRPRPIPGPDFKNRNLHAFTEGDGHRPASTSGNVNTDVLTHYDEDSSATTGQSRLRGDHPEQLAGVRESRPGYRRTSSSPSALWTSVS
jgi:hypothetical protein